MIKRYTPNGRASRLLQFLLAVGAIGYAACGLGTDSTNVASPRLAGLRMMMLTNDSGQALGLFSGKALEAEFRYLSRTVHKLDLDAAPVSTDGWSSNIAAAEWPVMTCAYFGYACANLAQTDSDVRDDALIEMRWLLQALQTPRLSGFMTPHFGPPFGPEKIEPAVFLHGHFLNLALRYREVSGDNRYDALIERVSGALVDAMRSSGHGVLRSYRDMWWISDNLPAHSALTLYDRQFKRDTKDVREKYLQTVRKLYLEETTGLLCTYVDPDRGQQLQGARGISTMYGLHFLREIDPDFARAQYALARKHFVREIAGLAAVREFPEGVAGKPDIDSGRAVLGFGPSASGFAIAAAALAGDDDTAVSLLRSAMLFGGPRWQKDELSFTVMPLVGQAVVFFGKTVLLRPRNPQ